MSNLSNNSALQPRTQLVDQFGRVVNYIRLSITDRCDFRCTYCMSESMQFLPRDQVLSLEESLRLVRIFVSLGVSKVRITGGEPLVRKNAMWLFEQLGQLDGLNDLVLTTNGSQLPQYAAQLKDYGVKRINISLDTLNADRFKSITRVGDLSKVLAGIQAAKKAGFDQIKLNTVLMHGVNDDEALSLLAFAIQESLDISFIEEMPLGDITHDRSTSYCNNETTLSTIQSKYSLTKSNHNSGGPASYWTVDDTKTKVGFISPHSHNFCESCNRVRITCKGELFLCLGQDDKIDLMSLLRSHPHDDQAIIEAIQYSMSIKPKGHDFDITRAEPSVIRFMSHTGG